jgi:AraC family transcriptional regulator, arabinose operon regulatory protein
MARPEDDRSRQIPAKIWVHKRPFSQKETLFVDGCFCHLLILFGHVANAVLLPNRPSDSPEMPLITRRSLDKSGAMISTTNRRNTGGYSSPFSGVGMEFFPLGPAPGLSGVVIHEVGHLVRNTRWNFPSMFSPYWRLIYDWRPGHKLVFPNREVLLGPRRLLLNPDHVRCDFRGDPPVPTTWIHFTCERHAAREQTVPIVLAPTPVELALLGELAQLFRQGPERHRQRAFALSLALLQVVLTRSELHWLEEAPEGLRRAVRYVQEHFAEPLYNPVLARGAGLSVRTLGRLFTRFRGVSPARFIAQVRVREVAHLLDTTSLSLEEIAERTGLAGAPYLSRVFRRLTGTTASRFRHDRSVLDLDRLGNQETEFPHEGRKGDEPRQG